MWVNGVRAPRAHAADKECSGGPVDPSIKCPALIVGDITATGYDNVPTTTAGGLTLGSWLVDAEFVCVETACMPTQPSSPYHHLTYSPTHPANSINLFAAPSRSLPLLRLLAQTTLQSKQVRAWCVWRIVDRAAMPLRRCDDRHQAGHSQHHDGTHLLVVCEVQGGPVCDAPIGH